MGDTPRYPMFRPTTGVCELENPHVLKKEVNHVLQTGFLSKNHSELTGRVIIHVASRRQAHTAGALRPKTSESTDCRKKKREEFDGHV